MGYGTDMHGVITSETSGYLRRVDCPESPRHHPLWLTPRQCGKGKPGDRVLLSYYAGRTFAEWHVIQVLDHKVS
jgi:hypothetical protein